MAKHALNRTSPKGPGQKFIGTCFRCGTPNLPGEAINWDCPNTRGLTNEQAIVEAIEGDPDDDDTE